METSQIETIDSICRNIQLLASIAEDYVSEIDLVTQTLIKSRREKALVSPRMVSIELGIDVS